MRKIKTLWEEKPLALILFIAAALRLIAVIFAKGFGMHDDHFLIIEAAQSWVDGYDYNYWLPGSNANTTPTGHGMFYVGLNFFFLKALHIIGITDPQVLMYFERFAHALLSMITVYYGYKITEKLSNSYNAKVVGLILAAYWIFPFLSVRNLIEVVCIPFLILSVWQLIKNDEPTTKQFILSGIFAAIAMGVRVQTSFFFMGLGLYLLINKKWKGTIIWSVVIMLVFFLIQGAPDIYFWGYPFAEVYAYINVCLETASAYIIMPWFSYIIFILGILIPPLSILLALGYIKGFKKHLVITLPILTFLLVHSLISNKQERFILPIIPFFIIAGVSGMNEFLIHTAYWQRHKKFISVSWKIFWILSCIVLPFVTLHYSKKSRCESMYYLNRYKSNIHRLLLDDMDYNEPEMIPQFYLGNWKIGIYMHSKTKSLSDFKEQFKNSDKKDYPEFILFYGENNLDARIDSVKQLMPNMVPETVIRTSLIDGLLHKLNHHNNNQNVYIYKNLDSAK